MLSFPVQGLYERNWVRIDIVNQLAWLYGSSGHPSHGKLHVEEITFDRALKLKQEYNK